MFASILESSDDDVIDRKNVAKGFLKHESTGCVVEASQKGVMLVQPQKDNEEQLWFRTSEGHIINAASRKALSLKKGNPFVELEPKMDFQPLQLWKFSKTGRIVSKRKTKMCLDISPDGKLIQIMEVDEEKVTQRFVIVREKEFDFSQKVNIIQPLGLTPPVGGENSVPILQPPTDLLNFTKEPKGNENGENVMKKPSNENKGNVNVVNDYSKFLDFGGTTIEKPFVAKEAPKYQDFLL